MTNPTACEVPSDLSGPFEGDDDKNPDPPRERFSESTIQSNEPALFDLALARLVGHTAGALFAAAEHEHDHSPCGIHLYPTPTTHCARCARLAATLPDFLSQREAVRPSWFAQD